jgi:dolichol-phosphate mannosyltransferase
VVPAGLVGAPSIEVGERPAFAPVRPRSDGLTAASPMPRGRPEDELPATASCTFVVPAYNEEANILRLLDDFAARFDRLPVESRVIVVDDGSSDSTRELVTDYTGPIRVELVALPRNQGPGAAFRAGFAAALANCSDDGYIVTLEADTTSDLDALPEMFSRVDAGADLVLAHWRMIDVSRRRRLLSAGAGYVVRRGLGLDAATVSSFYRVYRASILRAASEKYGDHLIQESGFACKAELLAKLASMGARVDEVTVDLDWSRRNGESKMPVARTMLAYWRMMFRQRTQQEPA